MRRWELYILTTLICLSASISRCDAAAIAVNNVQDRHLVPLIKSTSSSLPKKENVASFISQKAATHAPAIQISPATLAIIVGLLKISDDPSSPYTSTGNPSVLHPLFLRTTISPNAP